MHPHTSQYTKHTWVRLRHPQLPGLERAVPGTKHIGNTLGTHYEHTSGISSFLVSNAQFPAQMESLVPCTQLYVSIDASNAQVCVHNVFLMCSACFMYPGVCVYRRQQRTGVCCSKVKCSKVKCRKVSVRLYCGKVKCSKVSVLYVSLSCVCVCVLYVTYRTWSAWTGRSSPTIGSAFSNALTSSRARGRGLYSGRL